MSIGTLRRILPYLWIAALFLACWLVWLSVRQYSLAEILQSIREIAPRRLAAAGLCAVASYAALTGFDGLGVRYAGGRLAYRLIALASFVSLALGHSIGLAPLGSGAVRARYYASWGLGAEAIAKIVLFCAVTVTIGQVAFAGLVLVLAPASAANLLHVGDDVVRGIGAACLAFDLAYVALAARLREPLRLRSWTFQLPSGRLALAQVLLGTLNFALLAAALHQLLADATAADFPTVAATFVVANIAALISHVPGGLGVIEWVFLSRFPGSNVFGPLLVYRTLYYLVPLASGAVIFGLTAFRRGRGRRRVGEPAMTA